MRAPVVLIAVYQPDSRLPDFVAELRAAAPDARVVVVDDGSAASRAGFLDRAAALGSTVLRHDVNRGKGMALKTGLRYAARTWPGSAVVCADPDGQHGVADVLRVAARARDTGRMVLGVRHFDRAVPLRRRLGNRLTRRLFHAATGRAVQDTQTGLRAFPAALLDRLADVPGERFEYEMNVLLAAARDGWPIEEVPIATSYPDDSSHFGTLGDSVRIYRPLLRVAVSALITPGSGGRTRT